jgi:hypothetical protein
MRSTNMLVDDSHVCKKGDEGIVEMLVMNDGGTTR